METYFGQPWPSGVCEDGEQRPTPVGEQCGKCKEALQTEDQGVFMWFMLRDFQGERPVHRECAFREVMGGIGHHEDHDFWCDTMHDPDAGLSYRESALRVWARYNRS